MQADATKKPTSSRSLWSSLPVTALLREQQRENEGEKNTADGFLLAAQGPNLLLLPWEGGEPQERLQVFHSTAIHGLQWMGSGLVLVRGGKSKATVKVEMKRLEMEDEERSMRKLVLVEVEVREEDWLLASFSMDAYLFHLTAHNKLLIRGEEEKEVSASAGPCILYSGLLIPTSTLPMVVGGTVLGALQLWHPTTGDQLHYLKGHNGVILGLAHCASTSTIVSTSDDRSAIIWSVNFTNNIQSSLPSLEDWRDACVEAKHRVYGHVARVHRALLTDHSLLFTAGEDGRVALWCTESGQLIDCQQPQGSSPIWSLCDAGGLGALLTGGESGAVVRTVFGKKEALEIDTTLEEARTVRRVGSDVLVVGDTGKLILASPGGGAEVLLEDSSFGSYCLLETDNRARFVMGDLCGNVTLGWIDLEAQKLVRKVQVQVGSGKILGVAVLEEEKVLVSCEESRLVLLGREGEVEAEASLPPSNNCGMTVATSWNDLVVVGGRSGGLDCFSSCLDCLLASWPGLHGKQGVTAVVAQDKSSLWSAGRDGKIRRLGRRDGGVQVLQEVQCGQGAWVAGISRVGKTGNLVTMKWRGAKLEVQELHSGTLIGSADCGGGHRSWAVVEGDEGGRIVFIKKGKLMGSQLWRKDESVLVEGAHSQQVSALASITLGGVRIFLSGGEETVIRVHKMTSKSCVKEVAVLRGHLSNIRCLTVLPLPKDGTMKGSDGEEALLVSGGGRAEFRLWLLAIHNGDVLTKPLACELLNRKRGEGKRRPWKEVASEKPNEAETRVMDSACWIQAKEDQAVNSAVMIVLACSDARLRLLLWESEKLTLQDEAVAGEHCLLQVEKCEGTSTVVTGSTGGDLMVWEAAKGRRLTSLAKLRIHQSGVNCLQVKATATEHLVLTGGDDCLVALSRLVIGKDGGEVEEFQKLWDTTTSSNWSHSAQVAGLHLISPSLAVSLGVDFRLAVWKVEGDKARCIAVRCGAVADPQGLEVWEEEEELLCLAAGVGMEITSFTDLALDNSK